MYFFIPRIFVHNVVKRSAVYMGTNSVQQSQRWPTKTHNSGPKQDHLTISMK